MPENFFMLPAVTGKRIIDVPRTSKLLCMETVDRAKVALKSSGEVIPVFISIHGKEDIILDCRQLLTDSRSKDTLVQIMLQFMKNTDSQAYAFMSEAWMSSRKDAKTLEDVEKSYKELPPSQDPNRIEVVQICTQIKGQESCLAMVEIKRTGTGEPYPSDDVKYCSGGEGRFVNLFERLDENKGKDKSGPAIIDWLRGQQ